MTRSFTMFIGPSLVFILCSMAQAQAKPTDAPQISNATMRVVEPFSKEVIVGMVGLQGLDTMVGQYAEFIRNVGLAEYLSTTGSAQEFSSLVDPRSWSSTLGFDPSTAAGWDSIGISGPVGVYLAVAMLDDSEPVPIFVFESTGIEKLIAFMGKKGVDVQRVESQVDGWEALNVDGDRLFTRRAGTLQIVVPFEDEGSGPLEPATMNERRRLLERIVSSTEASLANHPPIGAQLATFADQPGLTFFFNSHALWTSLQARPGRDATIDYLLREYSGVVGRIHIGGIRLVVSLGERTRLAFRKMFGGDGGKLAKFFPATSGWMLGRYSLRLDSFFQGVAELLPDTMVVERMKILSVPALMRNVGVDYAVLSRALNGHIAFGLDMNSVLEFMLHNGSSPAKLPGLITVFGVSDTDAADTLLASLDEIQKKSSGHALERRPMAGANGYVFKLPDAECLWVRSGDAILVSLSSELIEKASAHWNGQNLTTKSEGAYLDNAEYAMTGVFVLDTMTENRVKTFLDGIIPQGLLDDAQSSLLRAVVLQFLKDAQSIRSHVKIGSTLELDAQGGRYGAFLLGGLGAAVAIPAFVKYVRRAHTAEATVNLATLFDASKAYYAADHVDRTGQITEKAFPKSIETPPHDDWYAQVCKDGNAGMYTPNKDTWSDETWQQLNFAISDPFRFKYTYESEGSGTGARFTVRATGDLNCDGNFSTFERVGEVNAKGEIQDGYLFTNQELE